MLLQNKSSLINTIKTRNSNIICSSQFADMIPDNILSALKAANITDSDALNIYLKKDINMTGFLFDKHNKSNIINMLKSIKDKNCVKVLEVYDNSMIDESLLLVDQGLADCIEDNANIQRYTANTYKRYSLLNAKNKTEIHSPFWLSFQEDSDMMSIIKEYKVDLTEFDVKKNNIIDKINEIIKKIKYKQ